MASSRVGLRGGRNLLSATRTVAPAMAMRRTTLFSLTDRIYATPSYNPQRRAASSRSQSSEVPLSPRVQQAMAQRQGLSVQDVQVILPGTMIPPPFSQYPKGWREFLKFAWDVVLNVSRGKLSAFAIAFSSKPSIFKPARFKLHNTQIIHTAKSMHSQLAQALAEGNRNAISSTCVKTMAIPLLSAIASRPRDKRYTWELVKYNKSPKLVSHLMTPVAKDKGAPLLRQAVVSISSKQKKTEHKKLPNGKWVENGVKEVDIEENVCIVALVNSTTWAQSEWRLIGYPKTSTPEEWAQEKKDLELMQELEFKNK